MDKDIKRIRLLKLWEILSRDTDDEHPLGTEEILSKLAMVSFVGMITVWLRFKNILTGSISTV